MTMVKVGPAAAALTIFTAPVTALPPPAAPVLPPNMDRMGEVTAPSAPDIAVALADSASVYAFPAADNAATNCSWNAAACCRIAWYSWPYAPNSAAVIADTSSSAAASRPVVGPAAAALAALIDELISATFPAAAASNCGSAIKFVIGYSLHDQLLSGIDNFKGLKSPSPQCYPSTANPGPPGSSINPPSHSTAPKYCTRLHPGGLRVRHRLRTCPIPRQRQPERRMRRPAPQRGHHRLLAAPRSGTGWRHRTGQR